MRSEFAFLIPFIGKWPSFINLFLESCNKNKNVNFLLCSPEAPSRKMPINTFHIKMEGTEILERIEKTIKIPLSRSATHKISDLKPFYGLAFQDHLKKYTFWGYCDVDIILGETSKVLNHELINQYDIFSACSWQIVGHFCVLRNRKDINHLGFEIPELEKLAKSPAAEHIDEYLFSDVLKKHPEIRWLKPESLEKEIEKPFCTHAITFSFAGKVADMDWPIDPVVTWKGGKLQMNWDGDKMTEILYLHFMGLKHTWHWPKLVGTGQDHVFSKLGYGRVRSPGDLIAFRWRILYGWQCLLLRAKILGGRVLRLFLPPEKIRALRRAVGV